MKVEVPDLQAIADRIVAQAKNGEQIEAYVGRGGETSVRVYEGALEHFVSAQSEGVGIRVIKDGRTGTAYAGTLDDKAIAEVLADARDNVQFGTPDEFAGLAEPDGVPVVKQELWNDALAAYPTEQKIALAKWLARSCDILLIDEPTRGVDVGAKAEIYPLLDELAREGKAILVVSSELPELLGLCRRILVMRAGRLVGDVPRADATEASLMRLMAGVAADRAA